MGKINAVKRFTKKSISMLTQGDFDQMTFKEKKQVLSTLVDINNKRVKRATQGGYIGVVKDIGNYTAKAFNRQFKIQKIKGIVNDSQARKMFDVLRNSVYSDITTKKGIKKAVGNITGREDIRLDEYAKNLGDLWNKAHEFINRNAEWVYDKEQLKTKIQEGAGTGRDWNDIRKDLNATNIKDTAQRIFDNTDLGQISKAFKETGSIEETAKTIFKASQFGKNLENMKTAVDTFKTATEGEEVISAIVELVKTIIAFL